MKFSNVVFVNGWGIGQSFAREAFYEIGIRNSISIVQPMRQWRSLLGNVGDVSESLIVGYSLGGLLLMREKELLAKFERSVLLAPFVDLNKIASFEVQVKSEPLKAIETYFELAGLGHSESMDLPVSPPDLVWGLEQMRSLGAKECVLDAVECYVGENDPLIDAEKVQAMYPSIRVLKGVGCGLSELLQSVFKTK